MASSEVDLCNSALIHLGAEPISAFTDNSDEARACKQFYPNARDSVLEQTPWNFATTQAELSKLVATPLFGYGFAYQLPTSPYCLRALFIEYPEDDTDWKVKGRQLHTDRDGVKLEYIYRQTDTSVYTPLFQAALEYFLAGKMAYTITGSRAVATDMYDLYAAMLADAEDVNAQEGTAEDFEADSLISIRG